MITSQIWEEPMSETTPEILNRYVADEKDMYLVHAENHR